MSGNTVPSKMFRKFIFGLDAQRFIATFKTTGPAIAALHATIGGTVRRPSTLRFLLVFCRLFEETSEQNASDDLTPTQVEASIARMCAANYHYVTRYGTDFDLTKLYRSALTELGPYVHVFRNTIARLYARRPTLN